VRGGLYTGPWVIRDRGGRLYGQFDLLYQSREQASLVTGPSSTRSAKRERRPRPTKRKEEGRGLFFNRDTVDLTLPGRTRGRLFPNKLAERPER